MNRNYLEHLKTCLDVLEGRVRPQGAIYERYYASRMENAPQKWAESTETSHISLVLKKLLEAEENNYERAKTSLRDEHILAVERIKDEANIACTLVRSILGDDAQKRDFAIGYIKAELAACPEGTDNGSDLKAYDTETEYDWS
ncbi:MAG: hypothetical protein K5771_01670 [Oscillospiraceae bacterium]|nr:hypothetical protein [Oscillospiraceae bacterium]